MESEDEMSKCVPFEFMLAGDYCAVECRKCKRVVYAKSRKDARKEFGQWWRCEGE